MKIVVIMPLYNEGKRAVKTVLDVKKYFDGTVVIVDDGSRDNSYNLLEKKFGQDKKVVILQHIINLGKGAAMKTGVKMAWSKGADSVIFIDADGQHNPKHLPAFEDALAREDLVFGYRSMGVEMPVIRRWGNIFSINLMKSMFNIKRADLLCGFFGFKRNVYKLIKWSESRYGVETEIAARVGKYQIPFKEVKIDTIYIDKYKGVTIFDAFKILIKLPYWYFRK
ncbi:MAG: Glycosyl transferase family 2 [Candidatus Shapirobacteria bacterium GW2011_GWE1_38_92]|uniref:Glycosyl transferase family 2 n=3 Tax=Candidatus Shapironibacteriota TaxID=1752721 RepID=A0A0G0JXY0_9BACT|nr:MAG: Glycosyl transferase family 2 [Candidatus Shapirobacteria bacterium GW2011_GWE2_38_30]KKQ92844.1 MAG: Glycosyl transferase family 2 [Candidatus Shapirobacteria bacterium GW2011_GWE1_38_92]OGL56306.1 MAG: hypothetical protein A2367_03335 [Candidatus Shapirobacteria bacterium RIFOXYB1_FULL_38_38]